MCDPVTAAKATFDAAASAISWLTSTQGTATVTAVSAAGTAVNTAKATEASIAAQKEQKAMLEEQNKTQAKEVARQNQLALNKRIDLINKQRKQILGTGDSQYSINQTGSAGLTNVATTAPTTSLTGVSLG